MTDKPPTLAVTVTGPPANDAAPVLVDVEAASSGWSLKITATGATYAAVLTGPNRGDGTELHRWPSLAKIFETVTGYLRARGLSHVASALKASAEAELRR